MDRSMVDLWVGLFVAVGIGALLFLALKAGNVDSIIKSQGYSVSAEFDNIGGLKAKAPVKSAGVIVGRVSSVNFSNQSLRAVVKLDLDERFQFPKDSSASILTAGLLGDQFVGIDPGGSLENLVEGDRLRITQSAIVLEKVIGQFLYGKMSETNSD
ncbi:MAG: outer membrane lipid asymmetry maintenance protein MlaD [Betaproteobacteria bacterium]|jgi:phospholipid/cholesterol/gamma-HCH transport system substrate-binding protein|nr:outer membrane lipid asymmetry maintenance protein MlaD [Betaproteobacteria bacterium]MBT7427662.1 outer membrane lipid asymmetry maintenance protein MlaD [Betaproteobacteria bacterium]MBT7997290.1 outer membrane lipid asymmetry maintenance protein MlaD [Betaproteobacteria bacterium]MDC1433445.1 outer membrane lipid asymmetry maintenance protein MlaD [Burkholderiales bacterium]